MLCVRPWVCWTGCIFPVSCVFARMHENAKVCPPGQRGIARPPWYGGDLQTGFLLERPGAPFGFVPGGGSLRAWCLGCPARGHGLNCHLSDGSWVRDLSPAKASKHLPGFQNYSSRLPPSKPPICARKARRRSPPTNGCRNGISGAWRRALICTARHIHGREA